MIVVLLLLMLLASYTTFHASRSWYVPIALCWTAVFLAFGWAIGLSRADMALDDPIPGLVWGGACIAVISLAMAAGVAIPRLHPMFLDERVTSASGSRIAAKSLLEIPLGTVLLEEIIFRSLVLGLLTKNHGVVVGVAGSSLLFGLWHILPALQMHEAHPMTNQMGSGFGPKLLTVAGNVVATGAAGVVFAMLVVLSSSVLAPMGLHWSMNSTGSIAAWLVGRRRLRGNPAGESPES